MQETEDCGFAKFYGERLEGSSLMECAVATRWCFVFMSSAANRAGFFRCANAAGLARRANVTLEEAEVAIRELEAPDPDSSTPDEDGRRIVRAQGGWNIVTHQFYRNLRSTKQIQAAERQSRKRDRDNQPPRDITRRHAASRDVSLEAEAEAELEADPSGGDSATAEAVARELVARINEHLPDAGVKPHPTTDFAVANLLMVGHPKGVAYANGRAPFSREDLVDAVHGWIVSEFRDRWHFEQRRAGNPFTFSRLMQDPNRLAEYAEKGRSQWSDFIAPPRAAEVKQEAPDVLALRERHFVRVAERKQLLAKWKDEKPPEGLGEAKLRNWHLDHARRKPWQY